MKPKYCPNCGAKLTEGAKFCGKCGYQIQFDAGDNPIEKQKTQPKVSESNEIDTKLVGIGGWLLLFSIGAFLGIFYKIYSIMVLFGYMSDTSDSGVIFLLVGVLGEVVVLCLIVAYLITLFLRLNAAKVLAVVMLAANLIILIAYTWLVDLIIKSAGNEPPQDLWGAVPAVVVNAVIWIPYFLVSKRVKATLTK